MKKSYKTLTILGFFLIFGFVTITKAQEKTGSYEMSTLKDFDMLNFNISLAADNSLWIDAFSTYDPTNRCGIILNENDKVNFITTVENARDLYSEWKKMAIENKLQDIKQKMHYIFFTGGYFTYFDEIMQDNDVQLIFAFTYFKGDYVLIINLEKMNSGENDLIAFNGVSIIFNSEEEINNFLEKISPEFLTNLKASKASDSNN